jgi:hypothetical protein
MTQQYWQKQTPDKPLFPDLLWSRPENRLQAGKLLIVGGNEQGFAAPSEAFRSATRAGIGTIRMVLPDSLARLLGRSFGKAFDDVVYAPSTPSGSFSQRALGEFIHESKWADGVLAAGDLGRNSETAILLEKFAETYEGQLTLTRDAADYFISTPGNILDRPDTLFVVSMAQLQKLAIRTGQRTAFTFDMDIVRFVDALHDLTGEHPAAFIVKHHQSIFAAAGGQVSSTRLAADKQVWRVSTAASAATWWLQVPAKPFEALTTSLIEHQDRPGG